jgi:hypothetical protein
MRPGANASMMRGASIGIKWEANATVRRTESRGGGQGNEGEGGEDGDEDDEGEDDDKDGDNGVDDYQCDDTAAVVKTRRIRHGDDTRTIA